MTTAGAFADTRAFLGESVTAGATALWQVILFYGFAGIALFARHSSAMLKESIAVAESVIFSVVRARTLLYASLALSCAVTVFLVASSGGLSDHLSGVSLRSSFLAGRYFLTLGYIPLAVALCLYVLVRRYHASDVEWDSHAWFAAVLLVVIAFLTGGRGPLVLGVLFPLLLLNQSSSRRFKGPALVAIGFAVLVSSMLMSILLRDNAYDSGQSVTLLQRDPVGVLLDRLTMGVETRPFDSLILLNEVDQSDNLELLLGASYLTVPSWFIPGSLMPGKIGGANAWFTSNYLPRFYYPDRIETSISAIGKGSRTSATLGSLWPDC
ncbi:MAG: hypothetical protein IPL43_10265 [Micropruina sp.]|nr:hypothetical protein [Micropruina sp.]